MFTGTVLAAALLVGMLSGQPPQIEVTSIKPGIPGKTLQDHSTPLELSLANCPLRLLVLQAFDIRDNQVIGIPESFAATPWTVQIKSTKPAAQKEWATLLRQVLADRFQFRFHWEERVLPVYALIAPKGRVKLREAKEDDEESTGFGAGELSGSNASLAELASLLNGGLDRPVVDRTGIEGRFDFRLQWTPDGSDIFGALRSELGLQLKARKAPVRVLVIDHVEQPSAN